MSRPALVSALTAAYRELFERPEYAAARARGTPEDLAERMVAGLVAGTADKDGEGVRRACKACGIKHTYRAIREYVS